MGNIVTAHQNINFGKYKGLKGSELLRDISSRQEFIYYCEWADRETDIKVTNGLKILISKLHVAPGIQDKIDIIVHQENKIRDLKMDLDNSRQRVDTLEIKSKILISAQTTFNKKNSELLHRAEALQIQNDRLKDKLNKIHTILK